MSPSLNYIPPDDLQACWDLVRVGLQKVHRRSRSTWIPEDVYSAIRTGHSTLHIGYIDGDYVGFMVLTPSQTWDGKNLHVWCVYSTGEHDVIKIFFGDLEKLSRACGARRITFWGPKAWERYGVDGFKANQVEYVREL